ncbi:hypothetical protein [Arthrobacter sp. ISL-72]|uniref:hypothetical protein n=1 Tax=Arthrobacter sp. ISL-72 TaxID=2819114 RepID=UPI001BE712B9|nr:hypothetical protein [Arthrobacter sp. ISL-72]MBT2593911.1 hypothetical protein [Arthrobacter sp. ISL-72]
MSDTSSSRNQRIIDELLADAGMDNAGMADAAVLGPVLLELRSLAADSPRPSAEVEALMASSAALSRVPAAAAAPAVDELAARRRRKRRMPLTALSVAAALAAGGAAAAASDGNFRQTMGNVGHAVTLFVGTMTPGHGGKTAGQPAQEPGTPVPGSPTPTPATPAPAPADGGSATGSQGDQGATHGSGTPSPGTPRTPALNLPAKADPRNPGTVPGTGQAPAGKPLPTAPASPDPSGLIGTPPVELPGPEVPSPSPNR